MEDVEVSVRLTRRWPLLAVLALSGLWLAAVVIGLVQAPPASWAGAAPGLLAPLALAALVLALLPRAGQAVPLAAVEDRLAAAQTDIVTLTGHLQELDSALAAAAGRAEALRQQARHDGDGLGASAAALEGAAAALAPRRAASPKGWPRRCPALPRRWTVWPPCWARPGPKAIVS